MRYIRVVGIQPEAFRQNMFFSFLFFRQHVRLPVHSLETETCCFLFCMAACFILLSRHCEARLGCFSTLPPGRAFPLYAQTFTRYGSSDYYAFANG